MYHKIPKTVLTFEEKLVNGVRIQTLKDDNDEPKFQRIGFNKWEKVELKKHNGGDE